MKLTRLAIIGLGSIGRRHLRIISEIRPDIEIIIVRSGNGMPCNEEQLASKIVFSIKEAISFGIQAAIISSPATFHLQQSLYLAKNGVHLLIEKPLSNTSKGLHELLKVVNTNNIIAMVGYVLRYDAGAIKFKNWLDNKIVGEILHARIECGSYLPDWRPNQDYKKTVSASSKLGGGVLLELSHEIDYLHWFFGKPLDVQAKINNSLELDIDVEDQADLLLSSLQGYPISLQIDFNRRYLKRECVIISTQGELIWNAVDQKVTLRTINEKTLNYEYHNERDDIYNTQLKSFFECIEKGNKPKVSIEDGMNVVRLIEAAHNASKSGSKVFL